MAQADFWNDKSSSDEVISELSDLKKLVDTTSKLEKEIKDSIDLIELYQDEIDEEIYKELINTKKSVEKEFREFETLLLLNGEYDKFNVTVEIHAGAGGTEACDWALMLYRMYIRWCEKKKFKTELIDYQVGSDEVGIKSATILVKGTYAYGYLKNEKGIHRLVRLSPFDSNNRRHTSFASVDVIPEIEVNNEIKPLYSTILNCIKCLNSQGRLCVITFHSLEDRAVKKAMLDAKGKCTCPPDLPYCVCGAKSEGKIITKKPIIASKEEQEEHSRSKSAKLRIFEKA